MFSVETIAGIQLALYGAGWALAAALIVEERPALLHWTAYALLQALSALVAAPAMAVGAPPPMASLVASALGFGAAMRGVDTFASGRPVLDRWLLLLLLPTIALMVGAGVMLSSPTRKLLWVGEAYSLGLGALMLTYVIRCWAPLRAAHGRMTTALVLAPAVSVGLLAALSAVLRFELDSAAYASVQEAARVPNVIGSIVASALFNFAFVFLVVSRLLGRLRDSARTDHLTGVLNRRTIEANLAVALEQHRRTGSGLAIALVDVDHFKRINDEHGHAAGDRALTYAATLLRERTRPYDSIGRWGGEEFVIVMVGARAAAAAPICERLRTTLAEGSAAGAGVAFTVSIGVAASDRADDSVASLLERADQAMYDAKRTGRDRVCVAA